MRWEVMGSTFTVQQNVVLHVHVVVVYVSCTMYNVGDIYI